MLSPRRTRSDAGMPRPHRYLSVKVRDRIAASYLAGVLIGDGYLTDGGLVLGLKVKDHDFATEFCRALKRTIAAEVRPTVSEGYWRVTCRRASGFAWLRAWLPESDAERGAWLRGFFDSEGSASIAHRPNLSPNAIERKIAMYSTAPDTLSRAEQYLQRLGIASVTTSRDGRQPGRYGTLRIYELRIRAGQAQYESFARLVGSSIQRKAVVLERLHRSYRDRREYCALGGRRGSATRWGKK
jgi:hypothetical protein